MEALPSASRATIDQGASAILVASGEAEEQRGPHGGGGARQDAAIILEEAVPVEGEVPDAVREGQLHQGGADQVHMREVHRRAGQQAQGQQGRRAAHAPPPQKLPSDQRNQPRGAHPQTHPPAHR